MNPTLAVTVLLVVIVAQLLVLFIGGIVGEYKREGSE